MRRLLVLAAAALLVVAMLPLAGSATTTVTTKHVDGTVVVTEANGTDAWLARFEIRTTPSGTVQFGYLALYGIGGIKTGQIVQMAVDRVEYYRAASGAPGARLYMREWGISPEFNYVPNDVYDVTDGASVGVSDTFLGSSGWTVGSGNISIYTTSGQNMQ